MEIIVVMGKWSLYVSIYFVSEGEITQPPSAELIKL
jgi:hypothetical protein